MSSTSHEDCETPNNYQPTVPNYPWLIPRYLNGVIGASLFPFFFLFLFFLLHKTFWLLQKMDNTDSITIRSYFWQGP